MSPRVAGLRARAPRSSISTGARIRVERIPQPITDEVYGKDEQDEENRGEVELVSGRGTCRLPVVIDQRPQRNVGGLHAEAEEGKSDLTENQAAHVDRGIDDQE